MAPARPPITFPCTACQRTLRAAAGVAGRPLRCPYCDRRVIVPVADSQGAPSGPTDSSLPAGFPAHRTN